MSTASRRGFLAAAGGAGAAALATGATGGTAALHVGGAAGAAGPEVPLLSTYVAGAGRHCAPSAFVALEPGAALALRREPGNDYDARTVAVWSAGGDKLGYVPRIHNQALANLMDAGLVPVARVGRVVSRGKRPELALDVGLVLAR